MKPFSGKLKRRANAKEGTKKVGNSSTWSASSMTWLRRRGSTDEEAYEEEMENITEDIEDTSTANRNREADGEDESGGGMEKATGILKSIFGLQ